MCIGGLQVVCACITPIAKVFFTHETFTTISWFSLSLCQAVTSPPSSLPLNITMVINIGTASSQLVNGSGRVSGSWVLWFSRCFAMLCRISQILLFDISLYRLKSGHLALLTLTFSLAQQQHGQRVTGEVKNRELEGAAPAGSTTPFYPSL